ncbi:MAG: flagellar basal body-associated FliL family protein [Chloroflexi bacterium]|nr:flagellar basal body-associated FliL family protein [Chloroflexota bacterium]
MAAVLGNTRGLAILLVGVVGGVLVGFLLLRVLIGGSSSGAAPAPAPVPAEYDGGVLHVKERIFNLADTNARRYLKLAIALQFSAATDKFEKASAEGYKELNGEFEAELAPKSAAIHDVLTSVVSAKTMAQLVTPEGKNQLKQELMALLNPILGHDHHITKIYITDFVVQ